MGITGTTEKEAAKTVTGSLNAMKASWQNLLIAMGSGEKLDESMDNMLKSAETFANNAIPVVEKALVSMGTLVERIAPVIEEKLPSLAEKLLPPLIKAAVSLVSGLVKALPNIIKTLATTIVDIFGEQFPIIKKIGDFFANNAEKMAKFVPVLLGIVAAFKLFKGLKGVTSVFSGLFGGKGGAGEESGGLFGGLKSLAKMKTTEVLRGIANLAIILGGFALLAPALMLVVPLIDSLGGVKAFLKIALVIGVLGVLGGILGKFAGIVGKIPIMTVVKGLANMAIVIIGMDALLLIIGATSLLNFNYGRMAQLIGLIALLGTVGAALAIFAGVCGLVPFPVVLSGLANMALVLGGLTVLIVAFGALSKIEGLQEFITAGGDLLVELFNVIGRIAGAVIGGIGEAVSKSLPVIGENLAIFGENVKPLFDAMKGVDMGGVGTFFGALGGFLLTVTGSNILDGLTKWLTGGTSFEKIGKDLTALANGAEGFFKKIATYPENSFTNATQFFESISEMGKLPNSGGVAGWFSGDIDYNAIANGLKALSTDGVKRFFTMAGGFDAQTFENVKSMFASLGGLGDLPAQLDESIDNIVDKMTKLPKKMGDALKHGGKPLADSFVEVWKTAVKASVAPVNRLLAGANHILKEFGSKRRVIDWKPYAKGTDGHAGGNALVNDGNGAELVQMPNGYTFIPRGRNVLIPNAPKGMKVLPADRTAQMMGKNSPTFNYANGIGNLDVWSYYDNAKGLVNKITENISYSGMSGFAAGLGKGMVSTFSGEMPAWVDKLFSECGQSISSYVASKGVTQWLPTVVRALKMEGQYSLFNVARTLFQMRTESGGNPRAINLWDKNAKNGTPSKGLMQVIDPTFRAYAKAGFDKNIYDPLSNILASIRYAVARYGSLGRAYRGVGYGNGAIVSKPTWGVFGEEGTEANIPLTKSKRRQGLGLWAKAGDMLGVSYAPDSGENHRAGTIEYNDYSPQFIFQISGSSDDRALAKKVKKVVKEAIDEMLDETERQNPSLIEV